MLFGLFQNINEGVEEYREASNAVLMDVREVDEYQDGFIPGAVNVPLSELESMGSAGGTQAPASANSGSAVTFGKIPKDAEVFVYCLRGSRAGAAADILKKLGYKNVKNIGGIASYKGKIEKP